MDNKFQFEIKINQFPHSCYPQEAWNMPHNITHSSQHFLNAQGTGRNMLNSHQRPVYHDLPPQKRSRTQFQYTNTGNTFKNQVPDNSFGGFETKNISSMGLPPKVFTNPLRVPPLIPSVQSHGPVTNTSWPNSVPVVQFHGPATSTVMSSPMPVAMQGHGNAMNPIRPYPISVMQSHSTATTTCTSMYMNPVRPNPINPMSLPQQPFPGALLPQPSSFPPPSTQQVIPNQQPCTGLSGFTDSLSAQEQDCVGLEFDAAKLKVRHESVIRALYADLPRQCASCGLRFKNQEEHRRHMDWHVVRNRMNKNQKQKHTSSRKWFANLSLWVKGAEASATEAVPIFFATKTIEEEKVVEELFAVIADEDQKICALCHEAFEDFFSHEADDWMYKGAVYLNSAPEGSIPGIDSFQLGPIVHAKCRPESSVISSNDVRQNRGIIH